MKVKFLLGLAIILLAFIQCSSTLESRPNIIFILADDLGWADLGCYGNPFNESPNIDALAESGMRFTDAYAAAPVCSPTRMAILTGQYPARTGLTEWIPGHWFPYQKLTVPLNRQAFIPGETVTMADMLSEAGYYCGFFGKWHLGDQEVEPSTRLRSSYPDRVGFDEAVITPHPYGGRHLRYFNFNTYPAQKADSSRYLTDYLTDLSIEFIKANADRPFFLYLSHLAVHNPLKAKSEQIKEFENKPKPASGINHPVYAAMISHLDEGIGRISQMLNDLGITENTIVVFYSDNGGVQGYRGGRSVNTSNAPLRDQKGTLYEGGIRVPLIISWPGEVTPGTVCREPVTSVDFFPTFARLAGGKQSSDRPLDGLSLLPLLSGDGKLDERALFWHYPHYHSSTPASTMRDGEWKILEFYEDRALELYHLEEDIGETENLVVEHPELAESMRQKLKLWRLRMGAASPVPNPDYDFQRRFVTSNHPQALE